jgi:aldehyde:ferredoxin oxidoreductase
LISSTDTDGLQLAWGDAQTYIEAIKRIVTQPNDFYRALARGIEHAASIYGGADFALAFGKNEMPGYHTGPGCHLGYLTGARHSHLDSAGYSLDQDAVRSGKSMDPEAIAEGLLYEERWRQVLTSLPICLFARKMYSPEMVTQALSTVGYDWTQEDLDQLGAETLRLKNAFKQREGFSFGDLRLPGRIFETPAPTGNFDEEFIRRAIEHYASFV